MRGSHNYNRKGMRVLVLFITVLSMFFITNSIEVSAQGCCIPPPHSDECFPVADSSQCSYTYQDGSCLEPNPDGISLCTKGCCCDPARAADFIQCVDIVEGVYVADNFIQTDYAYEQGYCEQACNAIVEESLPISGTVYYNDGTTPAPARISFLAETGSGINKEQYSFSGITETDGTFSIDVSKEKTYQVSVAKVDDPTCIATNTPDIEMGSTAISGQTYSLSCSAPPVTVCTPDWVITYEKPVEQCGEILDIDDAANCADPGQPPFQIGDYVQCIPGGGDSCKITDGYECERDPALRFKNGIDECNDYDPKYYSGFLSCSFDCQVTTENCKTCPDNVNDCGLEHCIPECPVCTSDLPVCTPPADCSAYAVEMTNVAFSTEGKTFDVSWGYVDPLGGEDCAVDHYDLFGCEGVETGGNVDCVNPFSKKPISLGIDKNTNQFTNIPLTTEEYEDLIGKYYCFNVTAISADLSKETSDMKCMIVPGGFCLDKEEGWYCDDNYQVHCDSKQGIIYEDHRAPCHYDEDTGRPTGLMCVDRDGPDVHGSLGDCEGTEICDYCNGPFGMFSYRNHKFKEGGEYLNYRDLFDLVRENNGESTSNVYNCEAAETLNICYADDYSLVDSPLGQYKACSTITNCYDYKTKTSCDSNPCGYEASGSCEWVSITEQDEFGLGVCRPQDPELQDCSVCDVNSPLGYCPEEICMLYSADTCYYNEIKMESPSYIVDTKSCMNYKDVACETYDTENDCIGIDHPFEIDLQYTFDGRKYGTNAVIQPSADVVRKGVCVWNGERCLKDSDDTMAIKIAAGEQLIESDCAPSDASCLTDNETPQTIVFNIEQGGIYSKEEIGEIGYITTDNVYTTEEELETFFSITSRGSYEYPSLTREELNLVLSELNGGSYDLNFFSKDFAENHEEVKKISFTLMDDLTVTVTTNVEYLYISSADVFESNLTINAELIPDSRLSDHIVFCSSTLEFTPLTGRKQTFVGRGDGTLEGPIMEWNYTRLEDGDYDLVIECNDNHDQTTIISETIVIDANPTISTPEPHGEIFRSGDVDISITSQKKSECHYTEDTDLTNANWKAFEASPDGLSHTATVTPENNHPDNEGVYLYQPKCAYDAIGGREEFIGNPADIVYFAVDETPPIVVVSGEEEGPTNSLVLTFECKDNSLIHPTKYLNFGCDELRYCEFFTQTGTQCVPDEEPSAKAKLEDGVVKWSQSFPEPAEGSPEKSIVIFVNDTGGNQRTYVERLENLRNLNFNPPIVKICDPSRGIPCE